jgi:hypothetical protein
LLREAARRDQLRPAVILALSTFLMTTWWYFGSCEFYARRLAGWFPASVDGAAAAATWCFLSTLVLLGIIPALVVKLVFHQRLADYGVQWGDRVRTVRSFLVLAPICVLCGFLASCDPAVREYYPINRHAGQMFGFHAISYAAFYLGWEFHFRGFMLFGLRRALGDVNSILVQVLASSMLHFGRPAVEVYSSIFAAAFWGWLAFRTRSLASGTLQHYLLGAALDWFIVAR